MLRRPFVRRVLPSLAVVAVLSAGMAFAATVDDQIKARQDEMKANGEALKSLAGIIRGVTPYDAAMVTSALAAMTKAMADAKAANAWDVSARSGTIQTHALPAVWDNPSGFADAFKALDDAIAKVGATSDEASFKAAFPALGQACKNCHDQFRGAGG